MSKAKVEFPDDARPVKEAVQTALKWRFKGPPPNSLQIGSDYIDAVHVKAVESLGMNDVDIIGYHGQTVFHHPAIGKSKGQTLQLGNGQTLARKFGVPCVYDFRTADVEAGGQGAPLAPIYHKALAAYSELSGRVAVVNIGGVSNVTLIEGDAPLIATDCGPGNGPLDSWMSLKGAGRYDKNGRRDLKSFDPNSIIICGGGRHNPAIMGMLDMHTTGAVMKAEDVGWDGDALEAQAFAYLAVRTLRGLPISFPGTTGVKTPMTGGVVVHP